MIASRRFVAAVACCLAAVCLVTLAGCGDPPAAHPAIGRTVGNLPLLSLADPARRPPTFAGRVTLLNFWGTWCPPCRQELPGLVRLAERLQSDAALEDAFQLVAVSCGSGIPEDIPALTEATTGFLSAQRLSLEAWADPEGRVRQIFSAAFGFQAFPTTYLIGPDATVRQVWVGYRPQDEAEIARALVTLLKEPRPAAFKEPRPAAFKEPRPAAAPSTR